MFGHRCNYTSRKRRLHELFEATYDKLHSDCHLTLWQTGNTCVICKQKTIAILTQDWCCRLANWTKHFLSFWPFDLLCENVVIHTTGNTQHTSLPSDEAEPRSQATGTENLVQFGRVVLRYASGQTDKQNGQADRNVVDKEKLTYCIISHHNSVRR